MPFAPDLAVEVMSPGNTDEEILSKTQLYLKYGTRLVWIVYPKKKKVHVYRPAEGEGQATVTFLDINGTLDGEDVLPGFKLPLSELFAV